MDSLVHDDVRLRAYIHNTPLPDLMAAAAARRDAAYGRLVSFSRKVFIPLTKLCRDVCHYCTFAEHPRPGVPVYLSPDEVLAIAKAGQAAGCTEAEIAEATLVAAALRAGAAVTHAVHAIG